MKERGEWRKSVGAGEGWLSTDSGLWAGQVHRTIETVKLCTRLLIKNGQERANVICMHKMLNEYNRKLVRTNYD